jgi:hypothetical protein
MKAPIETYDGLGQTDFGFLILSYRFQVKPEIGKTQTRFQLPKTGLT